MALGLRIPGWCEKFKLSINDKEEHPIPEDGYVILSRDWRDGDEISLDLDMPVRCMYANENIQADAGRTAIMRGPLVYALESTDNPGVSLNSLRIDPNQEFSMKRANGLPEGTLAISGTADIYRSCTGGYSHKISVKCGNYHFTAIPYCLWQNRGEVNQLLVWLRLA